MHTPKPRALALFVLGLAAAIVGFSGVLGGTSTAQANTWGAATNLRIADQSCLPNGHVKVTFAWNPSGHGWQFLDVSGLNNNFASHFANEGPLTPQTKSFDREFYPNLTIYSRVNTYTSIGWQPSQTLQFKTINCPGHFTDPHSPWSQVLSDTSVRVGWEYGVGNRFFCVDFAESRSDLRNLTGSWFNRHCGTTATSVVVDGLKCDTQYFWRTWAAGHGTSGYTGIRSFTTAACAFVPPDNLQTRTPGQNSVSVGWDMNSPAHWSCADYAESRADLENISGTWQNACTTGNSAELTGLDCDTVYYWRVFAYGGANANGYSDMARFQTASC